MRILREKKLLGYATVSQRLTTDGGKVVEMRMELLANGTAHGLLHKTSTYDKAGHPKRMVLEIFGSARTETIVNFNEDGAIITRVVHGIAKEFPVVRASTAPWADSSEFWFLRDHPKVGQSVNTFLFSVDQGDWTLTKITYVGKREITLGKTPIAANAVESVANGRTSTAYLSDTGDPIALDTGDGVTMEQITKS